MGEIGNLHLLVIAALLVGADTADEIALRVGLDVDDVAVLLLELEDAGAITTGPRTAR